ncbi:hypothetical protein [Candidatus Leptofilum sp.]|uniref:hypothetical protein n=1 Tax=Candidatus Leptofilum sp. TaxID=3241576 RepID=UPI003B5A70B7
MTSDEMKKTILIRINALVEIDDIELDKDVNQLDKLIYGLKENADDLLGYDRASNLGWISTQTIALDENTMNCGKCSVCNSWVTDRERPNPVIGLQNGSIYNGKLLCDDHLPDGHRWAF